MSELVYTLLVAPFIPWWVIVACCAVVAVGVVVELRLVRARRRGR